MGGAGLVGGAGLLPGAMALPGAASAQGASDTLVIAAPATPQGLDIKFVVTLGSIDSLGALYEYMLGYEKMPDPNAPGSLREDTGVRRHEMRRGGRQGRPLGGPVPEER